MKSLDVERLRKFSGLENLTADEAQKVVADLHSLSVMLMQRVLNYSGKFNDYKSEIIELKTQIIRGLNRNDGDSVDQLNRTLSNH